MQTIKTEIEIQIPAEYALIKKVELEELKAKSDYDRWWTPKDLKERYGHDLPWFRENVLYIPKFKNRLINFVKYPKASGKNGWQFEPNQFSEFMRNNFREIVK